MYLVFLVALTFFRRVASLSEVQTECMKKHNSTSQSNEYLVGTWYELYKFTHWMNQLPVTACARVVIQKPTAIQLQEYKAKYLENDLEYSFDDNPVVLKRIYEEIETDSLVTGLTDAKFFILGPKEVMLLDGRFEINVYKKMTQDYVLVSRCAMRGHVHWLWSRKMNPGEEEIQAVIKSIEEVKRMLSKRFCSAV